MNSIESKVTGDFSRIDQESGPQSKLSGKRVFAKVTNVVGGVYKVAGQMTEKTEGVQRIAKVVASALALLGAALAARVAGFAEVEGVFSGVKNFLDAIEIVGNVKEWGGYIQALGKSHTWKQLLAGVPKITTTFFFTIGNAMQCVAFVAPLAKGVYDVTKYLAFSIGNIPIFGTVMNGVFAVGLGWGIIAKGVDLVKAARGLSKASTKKNEWLNQRAWTEASDPKDKETKVNNLAAWYQEKYQKAKDRLDVLEKKKLAADEKPEEVKFDKAERKEYKKLLSQEAKGKVSRWANLAAELNSANKMVAFQELSKHKIERFDIQKANNTKTIVKSVVGSLINAAKITLIVTSVVFLAFGLAGLPFTLGILSAALLINIAGLGNFAWWELWGAKPLPVRNPLISVAEPRLAAAAA